MGKGDKGQAYLFVLILMLSVFIMLSLALYISGYEVQVSSAYHDYSNLYLLAVSGAGEGAALINRILIQAHSSLAATAGNQIVNDMIKNNTAFYVEYRPASLSQVRQGDFHLKEKNASGLLGEADVLFQRIYGELAAEYIEMELERLLEEQGENHWFSYVVNDYPVTVEIKREDASFAIASTALSPSGNGKALVEARAACDFGSHDEILKPVFGWRTPLPWSEYVLYAKGGISVTGEDIVLEETLSGAFWETNPGVSFPETGWTLENPFVFTEQARLELDAGNFYSPQTGEPVYTALYAAGDLVLEAGDGSRNVFWGCVAARGHIILRDVTVRGTILAGGDIIVENTNSEEMAIQKDTGAVFRIRGRNKELERTFYDLLGMTDFGGLDDYRVTGDRLTDMLKHIAIGVDSGLEIRNTNGPLFRIVGLREVR